MERAELVGVGESAPQVGRPQPPLGDLDPDRTVPVVLHSQKQGREPGRGGDPQGQPDRAPLLHGGRLEHRKAM